MAKTYGQLADGINDLKDFESKIAKQLGMYPFLNWKNRKTANLVRKLYKQGYNIADTVGMVILNC